MPWIEPEDALHKMRAKWQFQKIFSYFSALMLTTSLIIKINCLSRSSFVKCFIHCSRIVLMASPTFYTNSSTRLNWPKLQNELSWKKCDADCHFHTSINRQRKQNWLLKEIILVSNRFGDTYRITYEKRHCRYYNAKVNFFPSILQFFVLYSLLFSI